MTSVLGKILTAGLSGLISGAVIGAVYAGFSLLKNKISGKEGGESTPEQASKEPDSGHSDQ